MPDKGKWMPSGCIKGDDWSVCWRTHDAQFWGVPQRRRRISVVARFDDTDADEILFQLLGRADNPETQQALTDTRTECESEILSLGKSVSGDIEESREQGTAAAGTARHNFKDSIRTISFQERAGKPGGGKGLLIAEDRIGLMGTSPNQYIVD